MEELLRAIHLKSEHEFAKFQLSLKSQKSLKKIVISSGPFLYNTQSPFGPLGDVTKYWIDPEHLLEPTDAIKNVITMEMDWDGFCEEFDMRQNDWELTNLETLKIPKILYRNQYKTAIHKSQLFVNLKKLEISHVQIEINELLDVLHFLGNTKNVKISASLEVMSDLDEEETEDIFNQALDIMRENFPFPDRILDLNIYESMNSINILHNVRFSICYGENGATLQTIGQFFF